MDFVYFTELSKLDIFHETNLGGFFFGLGSVVNCYDFHDLGICGFIE